ncbi:MAG: right-handed parallel beta-helix repeat-containing protein [Myxococcota bacterium]
MMRYIIKGVVTCGLLLASLVRAEVREVPAQYPTVQAAVDAASSGDEIRVAAGTYEGTVKIVNKSLLLTGTDYATLQAPVGLQGALVEISGTGSVELNGFRLFGGHHGATQQFMGLLLTGGNLVASYLVIEQFKPTDCPACQTGHGIVVDTRASGVNATLDIRGSVITDYQKTGILALGTRSRVFVDNVLIDGGGANPSVGKNGVALNQTAEAEVFNSPISGNYYEGLDAAATGVVAIQVGKLTVEGCDLDSNQVGVYLSDVASGVVDGNEILNETRLTPQWSLVVLDGVSTSTLQVTSNTFDHASEGVYFDGYGDGIKLIGNTLRCAPLTDDTTSQVTKRRNRSLCVNP